MKSRGVFAFHVEQQLPGPQRSFIGYKSGPPPRYRRQGG